MTPLLSSACAQSAQAEGTEPIDSAAAADHVWKTEAEPEKVIAVGQTTAELLVEFGLEDKVVGQCNDLSFDFTVHEMVMMGRTPHKHAMEADYKEDYEFVHAALEKVDMLAMQTGAT